MKTKTALTKKNHKAQIVSGFMSLAMVLSTAASALPLLAYATAPPPPTPATIAINSITDSEGIHSIPPSPPFSCDVNPLFNPISISGGGVSSSNPPGNNNQFHVQINWGDGSIQNSVDNSSDVTAVITPNTGSQPFTFTFSAGPHTYLSNATSITAKLYHVQPPGQDGQGDATISIPICVHIPPSNNGSITVTKVVNNDAGGSAQVSNFILKVDSTTVISGLVADFAAGSYVVSETGGPSGYTGVITGDCDANGNIAVVAPNHYACTITNTYNPVPGCTDPLANNYNPAATQNDGSCTYTVPGCTDPTANNYNPAANQDDGSCTFTVPGCTDQAANNFNPQANLDDGSCTYDPAPVLGCTDPTANNYSQVATQDDGSCTYTVPGCTDPAANNYNPAANQNDGSCTYTVPGCTDPTANNYNPAANQNDDSCTYTDVCPNINGNQATVPEGYHIDQETQNCVQDETPPIDVTPPVSTFDNGRNHELIDTELVSLSLTGQSNDNTGPLTDPKSGVASAEMLIYSIPDVLVDGQLNSTAFDGLSCAELPQNAIQTELVALSLTSVDPLIVSWSHDLANPARGVYCAIVHATDSASPANVEHTGIAGPFVYNPPVAPTPPSSSGSGGGGGGGGGGGTMSGVTNGQVAGASTAPAGEVLGAATELPTLPNTGRAADNAGNTASIILLGLLGLATMNGLMLKRQEQ